MQMGGGRREGGKAHEREYTVGFDGFEVEMGSEKTIIQVLDSMSVFSVK